jgi:hypothetical protein
MKELLQAFVGRRRRPKLHVGHARELGGRLLAELAEAFGGAFEARPRRRVGVGQQAHGETEHDRLHSRLEQRHPCAHPEHRAGKARPEAGSAHDEDGGKETDGHGQRQEAERLGVDGGDDNDRH